MTLDRVISVAPDAMVDFYRFKVEDARKIKSTDKLNLMDSELLRVHNDILDLKTSKPKGGVGLWTLTLASSRNYKSLLHPGAWALIYFRSFPFDEEGTSFRPDTAPDTGFRMLGIVRSVRMRETVDQETGIRNVTYVVSGEDFHRVLTNTIYLMPAGTSGAEGEQNISASVLYGLGEAIKPRSLGDTVKVIFDHLIGEVGRVFESKDGVLQGKKVTEAMKFGQAYGVPDEVALRVTGERSKRRLACEVLSLFTQRNLMGVVNLIAQASGSISPWELMKQYANLINNELYTELLPANVNGKTRLMPFVVLRAIPFSPAKGKLPHPQCIRMTEAKDRNVTEEATGARKRRVSVPKVPSNSGAHFYISKKLRDAEIFNLDSGKSDAELFNFFYCTSSQVDFGKISDLFWQQLITRGQKESVQVPQTMQRMGTRPYTASTNINIINRGNSDILAMNQIAKQIWQDAYLYESGTVEFYDEQGTHIPVGSNVEFVDRGWIAHVEQVDTAFNVSPMGNKSLRTMVSFSRLQKKDGTPVDLSEDKNFDGFRGDWDRGVTASVPEPDVVPLGKPRNASPQKSSKSTSKTNQAQVPKVPKVPKT